MVKRRWFAKIIELVSVWLPKRSFVKERTTEVKLNNQVRMRVLTREAEADETTWSAYIAVADSGDDGNRRDWMG